MDVLHIGHLLNKEAVDELNKMVPPRPPDPRDTEREIWMKAGERRLVEVLQAKFEEANEGIPRICV